jgi:hypothetical protein
MRVRLHTSRLASQNKAEMAVLPNQMGILFRRIVFKFDITVVSVSPAALK